jgi:hypothetical protein
MNEADYLKFKNFHRYTEPHQVVPGSEARSAANDGVGLVQA